MVDLEVFNIFSGLIPQQCLSRLEQGQKRQGLVPDFRLRVPGANGGGTHELVLAELKVISCCPTRYQQNPRATIKAVDRRASTLPNEYRQHARRIDREYGGVQADAVGPVEAKLLSFPPLRRWVFGAWREASEDVHCLVKDLATSRARHRQQLEGRWRCNHRSEEAEVAVLTGQVRRRLSVEGVRCQARCLLDRLRGLGDGAAAAARLGCPGGDKAEKRETSPPSQLGAGPACPAQGPILPAVNLHNSNLSCGRLPQLSFLILLLINVSSQGNQGSQFKV